MVDAALIGIDVGTTAVKAVLCDLTGRRLDSFAAGHEMARPGPGLAEQDPGDWLSQVMAALRRFAAHPAAGRVKGIGVTSQVNTHVFAGADLAPLAPAITWQDTRAAPEGARLDARLTPAQKIAALGAPIPIDGSHALARMAWVAEHRPDLWAGTRHVLAPKDWIIACLTGGVAGDPISSVGLVGPDHAYADPVLALQARAADLLPPLADPLAVAGRVLAGKPFAGVPVAVGTMDAWAAMFGVGVVAEGQAMNLSGTSEVLGVISATRNPAPGAITFAPWRGITLHAGPTQAGGAALDWAARLIGRDAAAAADLALGARLHAGAPLFLPHLAGERAPLWDPLARGTFAGLSAGDGPAELALAVMEGVTFSARLALETLEAAGGVRPGSVRGGGGGAASDLWCQLRAEAFGRPYEKMAARDPGALGALAMAGVAVGLVSGLESAVKRLIPVERVFLPTADGQALAERRYALWRALYQQIRPINAGLA